MTGRRVSPPLFESLELLGKEKTLRRLAVGRSGRRRVSDAYPQLLRTPRRRGGSRSSGCAWRRSRVILSVGRDRARRERASVPLLGVDDPFSDEALSPDTPLGLLANNLAIAMILPAVLLAVLVVHRERPGLAVVGGGPDALGPARAGSSASRSSSCVVFFAATFAVPPVGVGDLDPPPASPAGRRCLAVIALTTPFQAAAEEFGFRGYLTQAICSWFARPGVGDGGRWRSSPRRCSPWRTAPRTRGCSPTGWRSGWSRPGSPGAPAAWRRPSRCTSPTTW